MATPEKALCDTATLTKASLNSSTHIENYLFEDLRIDEDALSSMDTALLRQISQQYRNQNVSHLVKYLCNWIHAHE